MDIGKTLKLIRTNKGLSQRCFSKGIISASYYSKVEAGTSHLSADYLFLLLENVNVTVSEFYYILKKYKAEKQINLFADIKLKFYLEDIEGLKDLYKTLKKEQIGEQKYFYIVNNLILLLSNKTLQKDEVQSIKTYLYEVPSWGHFEFQLFSLCTNILELEVLLQLSFNVIRNVEKYAEYPNYEQDLLVILINLIRESTLNNQLEEATYFLRLAKRMNKNPFCIHEKLLINFFEGILQIKKGQMKKGLQLTKSVIDTFKTIDLVILSDKLNQFLASCIKEISFGNT